MILGLYKRLQSLTSHNLSYTEALNYDYKTEVRLQTCVPVLSGSDITVHWYTSINIYFLHTIELNN